VTTTLNKTAAEVLSGFDIHAVTDVTGFGLAGHAFEIAQGSGIQLHIEVDRIPLMREALQMYQRGMNTGANRPNRQLVTDHLHYDKELPTWHKEIFFDPQTNGGLLVALPQDQCDDLLSALQDSNINGAACIGSIHRLPATHSDVPTYLILH